MLPAAGCQSGGSAVISTDVWKWRLRRQEALHFLNSAVCSASAKKTGAGTWIHNYVHEQKCWFAETFCPKMIKQLLDGCWWSSAEWPGKKKVFMVVFAFVFLCLYKFACVLPIPVLTREILGFKAAGEMLCLRSCVCTCVCVCAGLSAYLCVVAP